MCDALCPGTRHFRYVGAPEEAVRAEGVINGAIMFMEAFEGIGVVRVKGAASQFDRDILVLGESG